MGENFSRNFTPQCHQLRWLTEHLDGWQFGEQGLIKILLESLSLVDGWCVEYGAGDGETLPLTVEAICRLNHARCILVEIDDTRRRRLHELYHGTWICDCLTWDARHVNRTDLVVIDIDGSDSVVMREMFAANVRPTLLVVEHMDNHFPIGTSLPASIPQWMLGLKLESGHAIQDTAETLHAIAAQHGYERIGFNRCNSFFVVKERFTDLFR